MYHLHRRHRLQKHFVIVGICVGVMISSARSLFVSGKGMGGEMQSIMPWTVPMAFLCSAVVHSYLGPGMIMEEDAAGEDADEVEVHKWDRKSEPVSLQKVNLVET